MVVALGAAHRESQPDRPHGVDPVDHLLEAELHHVGSAFPVAGRIAVEPGGHLGLDSAVGKQVSGDLLQSETIEGQVAVQGLDDPVAIAPGVGPEVVLAVAVAVGIPGQIQPVAGPLFAEVGRFQEPVDGILVGGIGLLLQKRVQLGQRGWEPGEVQAEAPYERRLVRFGGRPDAIGLQFGQDEAIHRIPDPGRILHRRRNGTSQGPERPVRRLGLRFLPTRVRVDLRPAGALVDPRAQEPHFVRAEPLPSGRHDLIRNQTGDELDEPASRAVAGPDHGARLASPQRVLGPVQPQALHLLLRAMAEVTAALQQRLHVFGEIDGLPGWRRQLGRLFRQRRRQSGRQQENGQNWDSEVFQEILPELS